MGNIITATLTQLKTYFEGWHTSEFNRLHPKIDTIKNEIMSLLDNYYNKNYMDNEYYNKILRYLNNNYHNKNYINSNYDTITNNDNKYLIQNNKTNKEAYATKEKDGIITKEMYNSLLQVTQPGLATGALAMDTISSWDTNAKWKKTNKLFDVQVYMHNRDFPNNKWQEDKYTPYTENFGAFTQITRFGAMRTLSLSYQPEQATSQNNTYGGYSIMRTPGYSYWDKHNGQKNTRYWLVAKMATEDEPVDFSTSSTPCVSNHNISFVKFYDNKFKNENPNVFYDDNAPNALPFGAGTYLVVSGPDLQNDITAETIPRGSGGQGGVQALGSVTWIAKNIHDINEYLDYQREANNGAPIYNIPISESDGGN